MYLYAIRDIRTGKLTSETGTYVIKKWYFSAGWAEKRIKKLRDFWPSRYPEGSLEVVKFELVEVK